MSRRCFWIPLVCAIGGLVGLALLGSCAPHDSRRPALITLIPTRTRAPTDTTWTIPAHTTPSPFALDATTSAPTAMTTPRPTILASPTAPLSGKPTASPWLLAYDSDVEGNDEIYLLPADGGSPVNVTHHPAEDRYPAWTLDGRHIAFQSNRDGNWEIYILELESSEITRVTYHPAYDGAPAWSPDGEWLAFESYRDTAPCPSEEPMSPPALCPDLEIYSVPFKAGTPRRLTNSPGGDYQPVWSPDGRWIAFTSWRDAHKAIYVMPADGGPAHRLNIDAGPEPIRGIDTDRWAPSWSADGSRLALLSAQTGAAELYRLSLSDQLAERLTANEGPEERPTWWPDGSLLFARYEPGAPFEAHDPYRPGAYHLYRLPPNGGSPQPIAPALKARHPAAGPLADPTTLGMTRVTGKARARVISMGSPTQLQLVRLSDLQAPDPRLVEGVDEAFRAWRNAVYQRSGHDFLGRVSDVFRPASYNAHRLGYLSWHKAGRAVDLLFDWRDARGEDALYVVREDLAGEVYWRLFLKCAVQDGSLGEPMTQAPWHFWWHPDPARKTETAIDGGRRLPIPPGYYVDVTALAERYGWSRIASYHLDDFHWQRDSTATEYWHYQLIDELTWYEAMAQIYRPEILEELFSRGVAAARLQTDEVMDGKGLPVVDSP